MKTKSSYLFIMLLLWLVCVHSAKAQETSHATDSLNFSERLWDAVLKSDTLSFESLLSTGKNVDSTTNEGVTALMFASEMGNLYFMKELINAGANVNRVPNNGITALQSAVSAGKTDAVELLLLNGANVTYSNKQGNTALLIAAKNNNIEMVELLLANNAGIFETNHEGDTALHYAARFGNDSLVISLIELGFPTDTKNVSGFTPLMLATQNNFTQTAELLVSYGVDLNCVNKNNYSALTFAVINGNAYLAELFLLNGADNTHLREKARDHWYLARRTRPLMKEVLREYGVKRNLKPIFDDLIGGAQFRWADSNLETAVLFGVRETKYDFLMQVSLGGTPFVYSSQDRIGQLTYQFWERNYWFAIELDKFIAIVKRDRTEFGIFGGGEAEYRIGRYRGTKIKPPSEVSIIPVCGLYFRRDYFEVKTGYAFGSDGGPDKIGLQFHLYFSRL